RYLGGLSRPRVEDLLLQLLELLFRQLLLRLELELRPNDAVVVDGGVASGDQGEVRGDRGRGGPAGPGPVEEPARPEGDYRRPLNPVLSRRRPRTEQHDQAAEQQGEDDGVASHAGTLPGRVTGHFSRTCRQTIQEKYTTTLARRARHQKPPPKP